VNRHDAGRLTRYDAWANKVIYDAVAALPEGAMTRGEMLQHVVIHTSYHRSFVGQLFYQVPARSPTTDLPVFLRDVPQ